MDAADRTRKALIQQFETLKRAGVRQIAQGSRRRGPEPPPESAPAVVAAGARASEGVAKGRGERAPSSGDEALMARRELSLEDRVTALQSEAHQVAQCVRCTELACTRTQTVFGVGNPQARLCFLGEAPGADEDRQGEPFVGRAGQLLNKILAACKLERDEVYILNVLKCRPPGNRTPLPDEAENCRPYLDRQLEIIRPEFICCLGAVAAQSLLGTKTPLGRLRGSWHDYKGIRVIVTYHPAYLLRNPAAKKDTWEDMKLLMDAMGREI